MSHVVLENISKSFAAPRRDVVQALRSVNLTARSGELTALIGPSGSGKTTLMRVVAGLEQPDSGSLFLAGRNLLPLPAKDREVAMAFQQPALYPHLTARENLALGLRLRKVHAAELRQRVDEAADLLEIGDCLDRLPQDLSGGQRQRVALGRAIVRRPQVYLLDEPLSQLDAPLRLRLRQDLRRIQQQLGATMILVTHDQADALATADHVAVMMDGSVLQCDRPGEIYDTPACVEIASFIGNPPINLLPVVLACGGESLELDWTAAARSGSSAPIPRLILPRSSFSGALASLDGHQVTLGIRPEYLRLGAEIHPRTLGLPARVERMEFLGADRLLHLSAGQFSLIARVPSTTSAAPGQPVQFSLRLSDCLFFEPGTGKLIGRA